MSHEESTAPPRKSAHPPIISSRGTLAPFRKEQHPSLANTVTLFPRPHDALLSFQNSNYPQGSAQMSLLPLKQPQSMPKGIPPPRCFSPGLGWCQGLHCFYHLSTQPSQTLNEVLYPGHLLGTPSTQHTVTE